MMDKRTSSIRSRYPVGTDTDIETLSLAELMDDWLTRREDLGHHRSTHTGKAYRGDMTRWAEALGSPLERLTAADLTNAAIDKAFKKVAANKSIATKQRYMATLRGFCRWLVAKGHLDRDPTDDPDLRVRSDSGRSLPPHFSDEDLRAMVRAINAPRTDNSYWSAWRDLDLGLFAVLLGSGLRVAEVCALSPRHVLRSPSLLIDVKAGKGKADRRVPITAGVARRVDAWIDARNRRFSNDPGFNAGRDGALFVDRLGQPLRPSGISSRLRSWMARAEVQKPDGAAVHAFRHTAAHHWIRNGVSLPAVQARLGHTNLATTSIYTRLVAEETADAVMPFDIDALLTGHNPTASGI